MQLVRERVECSGRPTTTTMRDGETTSRVDFLRGVHQHRDAICRCLRRCNWTAKVLVALPLHLSAALIHFGCVSVRLTSIIIVCIWSMRKNVEFASQCFQSINHSRNNVKWDFKHFNRKKYFNIWIWMIKSLALFWITMGEREKEKNRMERNLYSIRFNDFLRLIVDGFSLSLASPILNCYTS